MDKMNDTAKEKPDQRRHRQQTERRKDHAQQPQRPDNRLGELAYSGGGGQGGIEGIPIKSLTAEERGDYIKQSARSGYSDNGNFGRGNNDNSHESMSERLHDKSFIAYLITGIAIAFLFAMLFWLIATTRQISNNTANTVGDIEIALNSLQTDIEHDHDEQDTAQREIFACLTNLFITKETATEAEVDECTHPIESDTDTAPERQGRNPASRNPTNQTSDTSSESASSSNPTPTEENNQSNNTQEEEQGEQPEQSSSLADEAMNTVTDVVDGITNAVEGFYETIT